MAIDIVPDFQQYQAYVEELRKAGGTPQSYDLWKYYSYYEPQYEAATGQKLNSAQFGQIVGAIQGAAPDVRQRLDDALAAAQGDINALADQGFLDRNLITVYEDLQAGDTKKAATDMNKAGVTNTTPFDVTSKFLRLAAAAQQKAGKQFSQQQAFVQPELDKALTDAGVEVPSKKLTPQESARESQRRDIAKSYLDATGNDISDPELNRLSHMTPVDQNAYFANLPYKGGMNYADWTKNQSRADGYYWQYFGRRAKDDEITWAAGKSDDDIKEHIEGMPSRISGLNIGMYNAYKSGLDKYMVQEYGGYDPDHFIKDLHLMESSPGKVTK